MNQTLHYRSEIDGLRAVAILPVILFHAGFALFQGGYVGVDVFFVISGFLITQTIAEEQAKGRFTLTGFYERRARRILPALFVMLSVTVPLAYQLFNPLELRDYFASLLGVATFSINVLAAAFINYFGPSADATPLLHIWSLAVEEQFYLFFPLIMMLFSRIARRWLVALLVVVGLASLGFAEWKTMQGIEGVFYWSSARAWELLIGALIALNPPRSLSAQGGNLASAAGLVAIAYAVVFFDETTRVPGVLGLLPTIGAALVICYARQGTVAHWLLTRKLAVWVGLISYSAYLWHQPVLVFARLHFGPLTLPLASGAVILSLALAWASWRYVEAPFRQRGSNARISSKRLVTIFAPATLAAMVLGVVGFLTDGFLDHYTKNYLTAQERALYQMVTEDIDYDIEAAMMDNGDCNFWQPVITPAFEARFEACAAKYGPAVLLIGDSHARNLHNILTKSGIYPFLATAARQNCRLTNDSQSCPYGASYAFVERQAAKIAVLLFHQSGAYLIEDKSGRVDSDGSFAKDARNTLRRSDVEVVLDYLNAMAGRVKTVWVGPFVEARTTLRYAGGPPPDYKMNPQSAPLFEKLDGDLRAMTAAAAPRAGYLSLVDTFAIAPDFVRQGDCITYRDTDHFSRCGEDIIAAQLAAAPAVWQALVAPAP